MSVRTISVDVSINKRSCLANSVSIHSYILISDYKYKHLLFVNSKNILFLLFTNSKFPFSTTIREF